MAILGNIKQIELAAGNYEFAARKILNASNVEKSWEDIEALIAKKGRLVVLAELPEADAAAYAEYVDAIVLVPKSGGKAGNVKEEYVILRSGSEGSYTYAWEKIGDTEIDLSNYVQKGDYETDEAGLHSHEANVEINKYTKSTKNLGISRSTDVALNTSNTQSVLTALGTPSTKSALGANATFEVSGGEAQTAKLVKASIVPAVDNGVASKVTIGSTAAAASKVTESTQTVAEVDTAKAVVTGLNAGTDILQSASVTNGVLSFGTTSLKTENITPAKAKTIAAYTFADVAIPTISAEDVAVAKVGTAVDVATGSVASDGTGAAVATGISTINVVVDDGDAVAAVTGYAATSSENVLKGVSVSAQPVFALDGNATTGVAYVDDLTAGTESVDVTIEYAGAHKHDITL